jgi:predicted NBD/HSP70 family sugar kinase
MTKYGFALPKPGVVPSLDSQFRPAALACRAYKDALASSDRSKPLRIAIEQTDGSVFHHVSGYFQETDSRSLTNYAYNERIVKFLLWAYGGRRIHIEGPRTLANALRRRFKNTTTGRFDSEIIGERIFDHPIEVLSADKLPEARSSARPLGRHLDGNRIGFDLGGSDRKVAAVVDGKVVFSEEVAWDPYFQPDPQYHLDGIMDSLRKAAAHLPRVDAIGGSAAGCYVNNRVKVASLFRGVPLEVFRTRVRNLFIEVKRAMGNVPFEVVNDGEVTALAGSMALGKGRLLGLSLGTSLAAGYVNAEGNITTQLNELAFAPVDYHPGAPKDEWSGDHGVGVQYLSQQAVARLAPKAGIGFEETVPLPDRLKFVQDLMEKGDERAARIYQTLGTYLGYAVAHYASFYDIEHVLILGRVTSGPGGAAMLDAAHTVMTTEFPDLVERIQFHTPDERDKRHGQAVAAASLPQIEPPPAP